ncbi:MAG: GLUG motif-containing protein, partial [Planctomycetota bacterium]
EPNDPYLIYTAEQINAIGAEPNEWDKHFILMADIDLSAYTGTDFNIIGYLRGPNDSKPFTGVFDGNGHIISNFSYTSTDANSIGLFGYVDDPNAEIRDLALVDPNLEAGAGNWVGSLVGWLGEGNVTCCYARGGSVSGNYEVGGLVGSNKGTIASCYSTGSVSGDQNVGGLVGEHYGHAITNCYSIGRVSGNENVGGLVGYNWGGWISASFWDIETSGQSTSAGGMGKTTTKMQMAGTFLEAGWDFVDETANGTEDIWWILEGQDYPRLTWEIIEVGEEVSGVEDFETGDFSRFPWEHHGYANWDVTSRHKLFGAFSAEAGLIEHDHDQWTTLQVTLDCVSGNITFYRKVSSELGYDHLTFYIDGVEQDKWSGKKDWAKVFFGVTEGTRTFKWTYLKDSTESEGYDTAWIDNIVFPVN